MLLLITLPKCKQTQSKRIQLSHSLAKFILPVCIPQSIMGNVNPNLRTWFTPNLCFMSHSFIYLFILILGCRGVFQFCMTGADFDPPDETQQVREATGFWLKRFVCFSQELHWTFCWKALTCFSDHRILIGCRESGRRSFCVVFFTGEMTSRAITVKDINDRFISSVFYTCCILWGFLWFCIHVYHPISLDSSKTAFNFLNLMWVAR